MAAFQQAASLTNGKLYMGGGVIETAAQAQALTDYVARMEQLGARIDGMAIAIHASTNATVDYAQLFWVLAAQGKLVKLVDVQVDIDGASAGEPTDEQMQQQAAVLTALLNDYHAGVPAAQRGGMVFHLLLDGA